MYNRLTYVDFAKGISIVLVVYGHASTQFINYSFYQTYFAFSSEILFSYVMPFFFLVSATFQKRSLGLKNYDARQYLFKITKSLLLPYYSLSLLYFLLNVAFSKYVNAPTVPQMLYGLALEQSNGQLIPSGVLWFLFTLYLVMVLTFFSTKISSKYGPYILLIVALFLRSDLNVFKSSMLLSYDRVSEFLVYYVVGYCFSEIVDRVPYDKLKGILIPVFLYLFYMLMEQYSSTNILTKYGHDLLSITGVEGVTLSILLLSISLYAVEAYAENRVVKMVEYFGTMSILIYVFHMPTFTVVKKLSAILIPQPNAWSVIILFVPGVFLPLCYGKILSFYGKLYVVLFGRLPAQYTRSEKICKGDA